MRLLAFFFFLLYFLNTASAQDVINNENDAREELSKRGISDEEFTKRMLEKGYDLENIQPEQVPLLEGVIQETLAELEQQDPLQIPLTIEEEPVANPIAEEPQQTTLSSNPELSNEQAKLPSATIYGQEAFRSNSLSFYESAKEVKPPNSYILGPGDELTVSIWGRSQAEFSFTINDEGYIKPTRMARISLKGLSLTQASNLIRQRFSQYYIFDKEQFSLNINAARTITVNIFGEALNYGSYTISAVNTAFNALVAAGGPTDIGTLRNIKVISGRETKTLDVYKFLLDPDVQFDFFLQNNDIIHIPVSEKIVTISGQVKRPFKYELTSSEKLSDLIKYAGGFTINAAPENLKVTRILKGQKIIIDVDPNADFALQNGDEIEVRSISGQLDGFIDINGAVEFSGQYEYAKGMRINDLLSKGKLREDARTDIAFLLRQQADASVNLIKVNLDSILEYPNSEANLLLQKKDKLTIYSLAQYTDSYTVSVTGAVRTGGDFNFSKNMRVSDLVNLSGGLTPAAMDFAYILRSNPNNSKKVEYLKVDLNEALNKPNSAANVMIQPQDKLSIMSKSQFTDISYVTIEGAVRNPGEYQFDETLILKDVLTLAGGPSLTAATNRIDIFRLVLNENNPTETIVATIEIDENLNVISGDEFQLKPFDIIVVRDVPNFELQRTVEIEGEVRFPGKYALISENETLLDLINRAGGLTKEAFPAGAELYRTEDSVGIVILELDKVLGTRDSRFNYLLKDEDVITIPKSKDLVSIYLPATLSGQLYPDRYNGDKKISVAFNEGKKAKWYIDEYTGGMAKKAKARKRYITVEYPNGEFKNSKGFLFFRTTPTIKKGSIVNVGVKPSKPPKPPKDEEEKIDWNKTISNALALAASTLTVIVLANRLN